jgi:hypothetical protein
LDLPDPKLDPSLGKADATTPVDEGGTPTDDGSSTSEGGPLPGDGGTDATPQTCDADVQVDPAHCGACNHDCTGGSCQNGLCTLSTSGQPNSLFMYGATDVTVSGSFVYFSVGGTESGVYSCPREGCLATGPKLLTTDVDASYSSPMQIEVYEGNVYWTEYYDVSGAYRTGIDGGGTTRVSKGDSFSYSTNIAVGPGGIFWTNDNSNQKVSVCPLTLCSAAAGTLPNAPNNPANGYSEGIIIAPDNSIIWAENTQIVRCADTACTGGPQVVTDTQGPNVFGMAIDNGVLYWGSPFYDELRSCALSGCGGVSSLIIGNQTQGLISSVAARDGKLYWTMAGTDPNDGGPTSDGVVRRCDVTNCAATVVDLASGQASPSGLAIDDKSVYWSNQGLVNDFGQKSSIMKAPR